MNLLLVIDDYLPLSTRVSAKMMHELAAELVRQQHNVLVLTPGIAGQEIPLLKEQLDGVRVWRFKSGPVKDISRVRRLINESLLSFNAWWALSDELRSLSFEGIVYYSPTIFFGHLITKLKKRFDCPAYLILRDLFPQWAIDEGMISEQSLITKYLRYFERKNYQASDVIGLMSERNIEVFKTLQPQYQNLEVLRNWVSIDSHSNIPNWREKLGLLDKVVLVYGGNIGKAQDMPNLMRLALSLKEDDQAHFVFVGQGESYQEVFEFIEKNDLKNVTLMPSISQDEFKVMLSEVDIGLFSLAATHTAHNFPGKILGYIANDLPILGSVNRGNDLMDVINSYHAGFVFKNGDDQALLKAAQQLISDGNLRKQCGQNARALLDSHFSVTSAATKVVSSLKKYS